MSGTAGFWIGARPLVLASGSAARRQMLETAGIPVLVKPVVLDEASIANRLAGNNTSARDIAAALAQAKGMEASSQWRNDIVLAADQTLEFKGHLGMKPASVAEAHDQLAAMRGCTHQLHAAACLLRDGKVLWEGCATAELTMRFFSDHFLEIYLEQVGDRICKTVGAYEYEALGAHLFERVEGDQATILGLPLQLLLDAMRRLGLLLS